VPGESSTSVGLLDGKRAVVLGVANDHSIAWAIARRFAAEGARLAFTYPNEAIEKRLRPLAESLDAELVVRCDAARDEDVASAFAAIRERWPEVDIVVHAIAFAQREELKGRFVDTTRLGFQTALDVSTYSLIAIAREAERLLARRRGSLLTLTYFGAEKVVPNYNVMGVAKAALEASVRYLAADLGPQGVRVNAISAGPLRTLSSAGISGFKTMLHHHEERAPLRRNITADEVAASALYLCSDLGAGVTGEIVHVDAGYNIVGM
jgi:enoyl-[acyl-carrier protein] reductase I